MKPCSGGLPVGIELAGCRDGFFEQVRASATRRGIRGQELRQKPTLNVSKSLARGLVDQLVELIEARGGGVSFGLGKVVLLIGVAHG
jgi:hypothetical protein